jgi:hypothetical protein
MPAEYGGISNTTVLALPINIGAVSSDRISRSRLLNADERCSWRRATACLSRSQACLLLVVCLLIPILCACGTCAPGLMEACIAASDGRLPARRRSCQDPKLARLQLGDGGRPEGTMFRLRSRVVSSLTVAVVIAAGCLSIEGCAAVGALAAAPSFDVPPQDLDLRSLAVTPSRTPPNLVLDAAAGRAAGSRVGAGAGAGIGLAGGAAACVASGPLLPLCLVTVAPLTTAVGAVGGLAVGALSGAVVGAGGADEAPAAEARRALMTGESLATSYATRLAEQVRAVAHERHALDWPDLEAVSGAVPAPAWIATVGLTEIASAGTTPARPFALRVRASLALQRAGEPRIVHAASAVETSQEALTVAEWTDDGAKVYRSAMDTCLQLLAADLAADLTNYAASYRWLPRLTPSPRPATPVPTQAVSP